MKVSRGENLYRSFSWKSKVSSPTYYNSSRDRKATDSGYKSLLKPHSKFCAPKLHLGTCSSPLFEMVMKTWWQVFIPVRLAVLWSNLNSHAVLYLGWTTSLHWGVKEEIVYTSNNSHSLSILLLEESGTRCRGAFDASLPQFHADN